MKPFGDSIAFGESPHAYNWFKPLADGAAQSFKVFGSIMKHKPYHILESGNMLFALLFLLLLNV